MLWRDKRALNDVFMVTVAVQSVSRSLFKQVMLENSDFI